MYRVALILDIEKDDEVETPEQAAVRMASMIADPNVTWIFQVEEWITPKYGDAYEQVTYVDAGAGGAKGVISTERKSW